MPAAAKLDRDVDVLWVTPKAPALEAALALAPPEQVGEAVVIPFLNGVDHVAAPARALRERRRGRDPRRVRARRDGPHPPALAVSPRRPLRRRATSPPSSRRPGSSARRRRRGVAALGQARRPRAVRARDDGARRAARRRPRRRALSRAARTRRSRSPAPTAHTSTSRSAPRPDGERARPRRAARCRRTSRPGARRSSTRSPARSCAAGAGTASRCPSPQELAGLVAARTSPGRLRD